MSVDRIKRLAAGVKVAREELCCVMKQDIPEVEQTIMLILELLRDDWIEQMVALDDEVMLFLQRATASLQPRDRGIQLEADRILGQLAPGDKLSRTELGQQIIDHVMTLIRRRGESALAAGPQRIVEAAGEQLMIDGALAAAGSLSFSYEPVDVLLRPAALEDLRTSLRAHAAMREPQIRALVATYLDDPRVRAETVLTAPGSAPTRPSLKAPPTSLRDFRAQLERALGVETTAWLPQTVDLWAYRWFNIGSYRSMRQAGITTIIAQAVIDNKTTPFCRWVNGRRINIDQADSQLARHLEAVLAGDEEAMRRNWKLLTSKEVAGQGDSFGKLYQKLGLPPYHFRCRTYPRAV